MANKGAVAVAAGLATVAAVAVVLVLKAQAGPPVPKYAAMIQVVDISTLAPIPNAAVSVFRDGAAITAGRTNSEGNVNFSLPSGSYTAEAGAIGYTSNTASFTVVDTDVATSIQLTPTAPPPPPPPPPPPSTGDVQVRVQDAYTGVAILTATVTVGGTAALRMGELYVVEDLAPGTYAVQASAAGYDSGQTSVTVEAGIVSTVTIPLLPITPPPPPPPPPPTVTVRIEATAISDTVGRYHGRSIDAPLDTFFWSSEPSKLIGTAAGAFIYTETVTVSDYVEYGNSADAGFEWDARIFIDGVLAAQGRVTRWNHIRAYITPPPPTMPIVISSPNVSPSIVQAGGTVQVSATFKNVSQVNQQVLMTGHVFWPDGTIIPPFYSMITLAPNQEMTPIWGYMTPSNVRGVYSVEFSAFSNFPAQGGTAISDPVTTTFQVI